jgi:hypothetical protein
MPNQSQDPHQIVHVHPDQLQIDPDNARAHSEMNLDAVRASLQRFGQVEPLVVRASTNVVIGGNGRLVAMRAMGWETVKCVFVDVTDAEATALGIALNRTAELAEWDYPKLAQLLIEVRASEDVDVDVTGWTAGELQNLLSADWAPDEPSEGGMDGFAGIGASGDASSRSAVTVKLDGELLEMFDELRAAIGEDFTIAQAMRRILEVASSVLCPAE